MDALDKGGIAALSDDSQNDTSNMSMLIKSVKITADEALTIESNDTHFGVKYSIPANKDDGIIIEESGEILVPIKELLTWVKAQGKKTLIGMTLKSLDSPEKINTLEGWDENYGNADDFTITKIGSLQVVSKDDSKSGSKWEIDCYDPLQRKMMDLTSKGDKLFDINGKCFNNSVAKVLFSAQKKDIDHKLDAISVQHHENSLYFSATDARRCAVCKISNDQVKNLNESTKVLVPINSFNIASKLSNQDDSLSVYYNPDLDKIYLSQTGLEIRISVPDNNTIKSYPIIKKLLDTEYIKLGEVTTSSLTKGLRSASIVNSTAALFGFDDKKNTFSIKAKSENGKYKPNIFNGSIEGLSRSFKSVWGVSHIIEGIKIMKSDIVNLEIHSNENSLKITGTDEEDNDFSYYVQRIHLDTYKDDLS